MANDMTIGQGTATSGYVAPKAETAAQRQARLDNIVKQREQIAHDAKIEAQAVNQQGKLVNQSVGQWNEWKAKQGEQGPQGRYFVGTALNVLDIDASDRNTAKAVTKYPPSLKSLKKADKAIDENIATNKTVTKGLIKVETCGISIGTGMVVPLLGNAAIGAAVNTGLTATDFPKDVQTTEGVLKTAGEGAFLGLTCGAIGGAISSGGGASAASTGSTSTGGEGLINPGIKPF